jgi:hypothetical protein
MGNPVFSVIKDADHIFAAPGSTGIIVPGMNLGNAERVLFRRSILADLHALYRIVVGVPVTAQHLIRPKAQISETGNGTVFIRIQYDGISVFFQCKTAVSVPDDLQCCHYFLPIKSSAFPLKNKGFQRYTSTE